MPQGLATVPNYLTLFRIFILPLLAVLIQRGEGVWACVVLVIAGISDVLDGYLARKRNQETAFGKLMDPVADKVLLCVAVLFLVASPERPLNPWLATFLLAREYLVTGLRAVAANSGLVLPAGRIGKWKTFFQFWGLGAYMVGGKPLGFIPAHELGIFFLLLSVVLSYLSMAQYTIVVIQKLQSKER